MQKTKSITISPITCSKGHTFYPTVLSDGTIKKQIKCPVRYCRVYLDKQRVLKGLAKRKLNLNLRTKNTITFHKVPIADKLTDKTVQMIERPRCTICNLVFYDQKNLDIHNKRLHQQQ